LLTINDFIYFEAAARLKSITKAAEELYISQQAISASISKSEAYFETKLFTHTARKSELTTFGQRVYPIAKEIIENVNEIQAMPYQNKTHAITILYNPMLVFHEALLFKTIQAFQKSRPEIPVLLFTDNANLAQKKNYSLVCYTSVTQNKLAKYLRSYKIIPFCRDRCCLIFNKNSSSGAPKKLLTLNHVKENDLLLERLKDIGMIYQGLPENKESLEDILSLITLDPGYTALTTHVALSRYPELCQRFIIKDFPDFPIQEHIVACNKYQLQSSPYLKEFLDLFLQKSRESNASI